MTRTCTYLQKVNVQLGFLQLDFAASDPTLPNFTVLKGGQKGALAQGIGALMANELLTDKRISEATKSLCDGDGLWLEVERKARRSLPKAMGVLLSAFERRAFHEEGRIARRDQDTPARDRQRRGCHSQVCKGRSAPISQMGKGWNRSYLGTRQDCYQGGYTVRTALKKYDDLVVARQSKEYQDAIKRHMDYIEPQDRSLSPKRMHAAIPHR